ncbi:tyrosine-type recombinase/integrase [Pseudonocardia sp. GCM10023141]
MFAGEDPVTGKRHDLVEVIPAGPKAPALAEAARTRLLNQVDEQRNPRTNSTLDQLLDRYLSTLDVGRTTHRMYTRYLEKHVRPFIGKLKAGAVDADVLDSLYAELRRCQVHCTNRLGKDHRTPRDHDCDARCRPHECKPLSASTIRQIHFVLSGAYNKGMRWRWVSTNPVTMATPPAARTPDPRPPTTEQAAQILAEAWRDPDWGALVWLTMTTGARRGELCALRWSHIDLPSSVITLRRSIAQDGTHREEKDTKTHQQRRLTLDPATVAVLTELWERSCQRAAALGLVLGHDAFVFSLAPDSATHLVPGSVSQRYSRMAKRLGLDTHLHSLRHYSATELIAAGVDVRTVAGRLGHSGGGITTLRVYAAWLSESDQRASAGLLARLPARPEPAVEPFERAKTEPLSPREVLAADLRNQILDGTFSEGGFLPGIKQLAAERRLSVSTVHRAMELLRAWGLIGGEPGRRPIVQWIPPDLFESTPTFSDGDVYEVDSAGEATRPLEVPENCRFWTVVVRGPRGFESRPRHVRASLDDPDSFRPHLVGILRIERDVELSASEERSSEYELEVRRSSDDATPIITLRWS